MHKVNPFESAMKQLDKAAKYLQDDKEYIDLLRSPQRQVEASVPVRMDSGELKVLQSYRVQFDNHRGPYKGGIRFHQDTDIDEVKALAFWMAIKTATVNIPLGGGKGGVTVNPKELSEAELERLTRGWARTMKPIIGPDKDIPAPDVNTTPQIMDWIADEYGNPAVVTGKTIPAGGSEGRGTATAQGAFYCLEELLAKLGKQASETRVVIEGYGNAGAHFAALCHAAGVKVVAVSDSRGAIYSADGLDPQKVLEHKQATKSVAGYEGAEDIDPATLYHQDCDILAPAALENAIREDNVSGIKASAIVELANGPTTPEAEELLREKGVVIIPDVLANAGGVTVSYFEWLQNLNSEKWTEEEVFAKLEPIMKDAFRAVWEKKESLNESMRTSAFILAIERIVTAMKESGNY